MWRRVTNVRFLGVYIKEDLIPESTAETLLPECPQEEEHPSETVVSYFNSIDSILTYCFHVRFPCCVVAQKKVQRVISVIKG